MLGLDRPLARRCPCDGGLNLSGCSSTVCLSGGGAVEDACRRSVREVLRWAAGTNEAQSWHMNLESGRRELPSCRKLAILCSPGLADATCDQ